MMPLSRRDTNRNYPTPAQSDPKTAHHEHSKSKTAMVKMVSGRCMNDENAVNMDGDWVAKASSISHAFNKLLAQSACKLCSVYVDEQVEFENRQEDYKTNMAVAWMRTHKPEVEVYRQFLFDEESVVDSVAERDEETSLNAFERSFATSRRRMSGDGTTTTQKS